MWRHVTDGMLERPYLNVTVKCFSKVVGVFFSFPIKTEKKSVCKICFLLETLLSFQMKTQGDFDLLLFLN